MSATAAAPYSGNTTRISGPASAVTHDQAPPPRAPGRHVDTGDWPGHQSTVVVPSADGAGFPEPRSPLGLLDEHLTLLASGT